MHWITGVDYDKSHNNQNIDEDDEVEDNDPNCVEPQIIRHEGSNADEETDEQELNDAIDHEEQHEDENNENVKDMEEQEENEITCDEKK